MHVKREGLMHVRREELIHEMREGLELSVIKMFRNQKCPNVIIL